MTTLSPRISTSLLSIFLASSTVLVGSGQQTQASNASWDVTADLITNSINTKAFGQCRPPAPAPGVWAVSSDIEYGKDATANSGVLSYSILTTAVSGGPTAMGYATNMFVTLDQVTVPLKQVDASRLSLTNDGCGFGIKMIGVNGQSFGEVKRRARMFTRLVSNDKLRMSEACSDKDIKKKSCTEQTGPFLDQTIYFMTDQQMAQRFARALQHAIILSGGSATPSPF